MRKITAHELRQVEETLDWIRPVIDLEYVYLEDENVIVIGENYVIKGFSREYAGGAGAPIFRLIFGENHPGYINFSLDKWEEEDIATAPSVEPLLPLFVSNLFQREMERRIYSSIQLGRAVSHD